MMSLPFPTAAPTAAAAAACLAEPHVAAQPAAAAAVTRSARVVSGITPSGSLTLGNYLGALRRFAASSPPPPAAGAVPTGFFFVADLHAVTTAHDPGRLRQLTTQTAALFFATGLDQESSTVFVQSDVPAHVQLAYLLESTAHVGELGRMIQFKEKGGRPQTRASLFTYPCLMGADILLYDPETVPVGGDQDQHVELCRDLAIRFNRLYGPTFVVPQLQRAAIGARIGDLSDPGTKMSKTAPPGAAGVIRMLDAADVVRRKVNRAVTDSGGEVCYDPVAKPGVSNLVDIIAAVTGDHPSAVAAGVSTYSDLKAACADCVIEALAPIQRRYSELAADPAELHRLLALGAERARRESEPVLARARAAMGLGGSGVDGSTERALA